MSDIEKVERYGEEQCMIRNKKGNWIGEEGYVYVHEDKVWRLLVKVWTLGAVSGVLITAFIILVVV